MPVLPRLFLSHSPERDRLEAIEFGRSPEGQPSEHWESVGECAGLLRDGLDGPVVGFGVRPFSEIDLDDPSLSGLWQGATFDVPLLGLEDVCAAEIVLGARAMLSGRPTLNRHYFQLAISAQGCDEPRRALGLWLKCLETGDAMAHYGVGYTFYELGQYRHAYRHLRRYAELAPANPWNWRWYGAAAEAIGELGEAATAYEVAISLSTESEETDAIDLLVDLHARMNEAASGKDRDEPGGDEMQYGEQFQKALKFAAKAHRNQTRKGSEVPYIGHLLGVCSLVVEDGGTETEAIGALLHDAAEDQGGAKMLAKIEKRFGKDVAAIVDACSDTLVVPKPAWRKRKALYLAHLEQQPMPALRVSLADKLYNARAILADYQDVGDKVWARFKTGRDGQLWYYGELAKRFEVLYPGRMASELSATVEQLQRLVNA
jgi:tetratricopeptide (TPR) repeat protein